MLAKPRLRLQLHLASRLPPLQQLLIAAHRSVFAHFLFGPHSFPHSKHPLHPTLPPRRIALAHPHFRILPAAPNGPHGADGADDGSESERDSQNSPNGTMGRLHQLDQLDRCPPLLTQTNQRTNEPTNQRTNEVEARIREVHTPLEPFPGGKTGTKSCGESVSLSCDSSASILWRAACSSLSWTALQTHRRNAADTQSSRYFKTHC